MSEKVEIGERQTVQRAKHPTLGEGRLVYDNGPAFFVADSGEVERYDAAGWAGAGSESSSRGRHAESFGRIGQRRVMLDILDRECGPKHRRIVSDDGRPGWLVSWNDKQSDRERFMWERFEPDGGEPETMMIQQWWVGKANQRNSKAKLETLRPWMSMRSIGGHVFVYRNESDPVPPEKPAPTKRSPKSAADRDIAAAAKGPMPGPNATRAEVDAWLRSA